MNQDTCYPTSLTPLDEALHIIEEAVSPLSHWENVPLMEALDRVAWGDNQAKIKVPAFNNSAMDGYAVNIAALNSSGNTSSTLKCIGSSQAGAPFPGRISAGECVRIMTGASIPQGADAVVMQETTQRQGDLVTLSDHKLHPGANIRAAGEDIACDDVIVRRGRRLSPADIGVLASTGYGELAVYKKLRVALFATGNELLRPGEPLRDGAIFETNLHVLGAMLARLNFEVLNLGIIPDSPEKITAAFTRAASNCDAIISTGGASVGDSDYTREVFQSFGEVSLYKLAIKPGKPFCFGKKNRAYYFGLPGNPVSAAVTFHQLVVPALRKISGEGFIRPTMLYAIAKNTIKKRPGRTDFQRGVYQPSDIASGKLIVAALPAQGSGILSSLSKANCFIKIDAQRGDIEQGETLEIIPFDRWIS
ncbi:MAG: molybdopterin molybdotransferase MoeA [Cellvibrionaceae bacterium]|nr:molybdopterin molybdotransferase MoeA [Cellvibrionaceae bacterium]